CAGPRSQARGLRARGLPHHAALSGVLQFRRVDSRGSGGGGAHRARAARAEDLSRAAARRRGGRAALAAPERTGVCDRRRGSAGGLFAAVVLVTGRPRQERWWRVPLLAALTLAVFLAAPYDMGYMGYIHLRALPFLLLLVIASPLIAPGRATGTILAAVVALQVAY